MSLAALFGLVVLGSALVTLSLAPHVGRLTPPVLFSQESDIAAARNAAVGDEGITVDGTASLAILEDIRDSINGVLPSCAVQAQLADDEDELADGLLVDRLSDDGVFVFQSYPTRRAYWEEVALATAAALSEDVAVEQG